MSFRRGVVLLLAFALALACGETETDTAEAPEPAAGPVLQEAAPEAAAQAANVDGARIAAADQEPENWLAHGRTYSEQRFSPLSQIHTGNVSDLGVAWSFELGSTRGVEATPIVVDGVMYLSAPWSKVYALNAATGELLWSHDPKVPGAWGRHACCDVVNRGVAVWKGAVYVGTLDGRLVSLDAKTGSVNWEKLTIDPSRPYTITGAPRVVKDKVIIGNGGAEFGVRGYVTAYDAATGDQVWRFYTVPGDPSLPFEHPEMEMAAKTWKGKWWEVGGGGTAWDAIAFDPELDLLYIGTGNGSPWTRVARSPGGGDNLFLCAMIALRPDTGELVWHYQTTPGDNWDYTSVQHMILADLEIDGQVRKVIMQAPKNGFFYVLDRATGELLSAEKYVAANWASKVDLETGRPVETSEGDYTDEARLIFPGPQGGHSWHPMSFNPGTGLVYIPAQDIQFWYTTDEGFAYTKGELNLGLEIDEIAELVDTQEPEGSGQLIAWDPVAQKAVWRIAHAGYWNGGVLSTAGGLVIQGAGDGRFAAYHAETGEKLWEVLSQTAIIAGPVTYQVDGTQYVAAAAGYGGGVIAGGAGDGAIINDYHNEGRVIAFRLGATQPMPTSKPRDKTVPPPPTQTASAEQIAEGEKTFNRYCFVCHGLGAASSLVVPDLRYLAPERHEAFESIVLKGLLQGNGMPSFAGLIEPEQIPALHGYIISEAQELHSEQGREPAK